MTAEADEPRKRRKYTTAEQGLVAAVRDLDASERSAVVCGPVQVDVVRQAASHARELSLVEEGEPGFIWDRFHPEVDLINPMVGWMADYGVQILVGP